MLSQHRIALHRIPELGCRLPETAAYLRGVLSGLPCRVFSPWESAVCAFFDYGRPETAAFRSDMDALPLQETSGLPFASCHAGKLHACGHDGHMSILLGLAEHLSRVRLRPERNVLLIFEPAEETTGGAKSLCESGLLEEYHVTRIYGLHLWPELPRGTVASRAGGMMARSCELTAEITGKAIHIARYREGHDALLAGARFLEAAYALAEGRPCLLRFGQMHSGSARNAVSGHTRMEGTLRCFDDVLFSELWDGLEGLAEKLSAETGCPIRLSRSEGYPPVTNDAALLAQARKRFPIAQAEPTFITEDFSEYQRRVPGVFFLLGTGGPALHTPEFDFDMSVLDTGLALFCALL